MSEVSRPSQVSNHSQGSGPTDKRSSDSEEKATSALAFQTLKITPKVDSSAIDPRLELPPSNVEAIEKFAAPQMAPQAIASVDKTQISEVSRPGQSSIQSQSTEPTDKRPLGSEEKATSDVALRTLGTTPNIAASATDPSQRLPQPDTEAIDRFAAPSAAAGAITSVADTRKTSQSVQQKFAAPFRETFKAETTHESLMNHILDARDEVARIKTMYQTLLAQQPASPMQLKVKALLQIGTLKKVDGGKGGVYFLCDDKGAPQFVLKPGDEGLLAINNGKQLASPFTDADERCAPVNDIKIYEAVQNAEIASKAAEIFQLEGATPHTEVMIIEHPFFHDILDGTVEKKDPYAIGLERVAPTTKEKVCTVQPFIQGYFDIGSHLITQMQMDPETIQTMIDEDPDGYEALQAQHTPRDIDPAQFEKVALFSLIIGEQDGNAGNLMCAKETDSRGEFRGIFKIDNAASFPESTDDIITGLNWAVHNFKQPLSQSAKDFINAITLEQINELKEFMKSRGKSEESIDACEQRLLILISTAPTVDTIEELNQAFLRETT